MLVMVNQKDIIGEKYYKICRLSKKTYQINGCEMIEKLAHQLDLSEGVSDVNISRNISKSDDKAVYILSKNNKLC